MEFHWDGPPAEAAANQKSKMQTSITSGPSTPGLYDSAARTGYAVVFSDSELHNNSWTVNQNVILQVGVQMLMNF